MSPHEKSARGEIITELIIYVSPLLKHRRPHKKSLHYRLAPQKSFPPADNLPVKVRPTRAAAGRGDFSGGRRSYNGAAITFRR